MKSFLENIAVKYNCNFNQLEGTYDLNIDIRNLSSNTIILSKKTKELELTATCEYFSGTSIKPNNWTGNNPDQYRVNFSVLYFDQNIAPKFLIMEHGPFQKFIFSEQINFKCRDKRFKFKLKNDRLFREIMSKINTNAEFSPIIQGKRKEDHYQLLISYQSFEKLSDIFDLFIEFVLKFPELTTHPLIPSS